VRRFGAQFLLCAALTRLAGAAIHLLLKYAFFCTEDAAKGGLETRNPVGIAALWELARVEFEFEFELESDVGLVLLYRAS